MYFEYTDAIYISEEEFNEIVTLIKKKKMSVNEAIWEVISNWCDSDFFRFGYIEDAVIAEINRRLEN